MVEAKSRLFPPPVRERPAPLAPLTEAQRQFAAENHGLIYAFLHKSGCNINEYYDVAALSFLQAVQRYLTQPRLRQYTFPTIAWRAMGRGIASEYRARARRKQAERQYLMDGQLKAHDIREEAEHNLILHDLFQDASPEQRRLVQARVQGYSLKESAHAQGLHVKQAAKLLQDLHRRCALYI